MGLQGMTACSKHGFTIENGGAIAMTHMSFRSLKEQNEVR
jgi:hypothetical protein